MWKWRVSALVFVIAATDAGSIIFPGQLDHAEGDACTTNTGGLGRCSRSCGHSASLSEPRKCGIKDAKFLFCCDTNLDNTPQPFTDISPPSVSFQCGINEKNIYFLGIRDWQGDVLRPGVASNVEEELPFPSNIPGFPPGELEKAIDELEKSVPEGAGAAIGGVNSLKNAWPWMALLGRYDGQGIKWFCGGVLINEQWVLTALHCFVKEKVEVVRLGEHNYNDDYDSADHEDFPVAETVLYPDYNHPEAYHDLALVRLKTKATLKKHISPVCLPWGRESEEDIVGQQTTLTGWGNTEYRGFPSAILQEVNITVFSPDQCDRGYSNLPHYPSAWPRGIGQDILCAGDPAGGRDACQGDSGGPLVSQDARGRFVLAGIVSKGYGCGSKEYPGLYANLRHPPYLAWIKKVAFSTH